MSTLTVKAASKMKTSRVQQFQRTTTNMAAVNGGEMHGLAGTKAVASMQAKMHATFKQPDTALQPPAQLGSPRRLMSIEIIMPFLEMQTDKHNYETTNQLCQ